MRSLKNRTDVNNTDPTNYPFGRIKDNTGVGDGTAINEATKGDIHQFFEKLMQLYDIVPNENPDNEQNGYQLINALRGIATKNDFIHSLSTNGTVLSVGVKLTKMLENESIVCICQFNKGAETQIKGEGSGLLFNLNYVGGFKIGEYVRLIKTTNGVSIIRLADWNSLDAMATELNFLKKASQIQEDAGLIDTVATTPLSNLTAFIKRVIGVDNVNYLANALRNGLYPKEHWSIVDAITPDPVKNRGWFGGFDVGQAGSNLLLSSGGDISGAYYFQQSSDDCVIHVDLIKPMDNTNYFVRSFIQSLDANTNNSNDIGSPVFRVLSNNSIVISISQFRAIMQNIRVYIETVQL